VQSTVHDIQLRVRYAETDAMGLVHHCSYIVWFEAGRVEYMRQMGSGYAEVEKGGHFFAVSEIGARYLAPAHFDDLITVRTGLEGMRSRTIAFRYEVLHAETGKPLVTGFTHHVCINTQGEVTIIPQKVRALLEGKKQGG
jgi:acyl-CoA thioester hydrolase